MCDMSCHGECQGKEDTVSICVSRKNAIRRANEPEVFENCVNGPGSTMPKVRHFPVWSHSNPAKCVHFFFHFVRSIMFPRWDMVEVCWSYCRLPFRETKRAASFGVASVALCDFRRVRRNVCATVARVKLPSLWGMIKHLVVSFPVACLALCDTLHSALYTLNSTHSTRITSHFTFSTQNSTFYILHSPLYTPHSTLSTPHFTLCTPHSTLYTPHFTFHTSHFTLLILYTLHPILYTFHFTLHTLHFTFHTLYSPHLSTSLHSTLHTLHSTLHTLHTPHFILNTPHSTLYTLHSTLYTLHSTLYTPRSTLHFTLFTPHSTLYTPHSTLYTLHSYFSLYTPHSTSTIDSGSHYFRFLHVICTRVRWFLLLVFIWRLFCHWLWYAVRFVLATYSRIMFSPFVCDLSWHPICFLHFIPHLG